VLPFLSQRCALQHHIQYLESQPADHEVLRLGLENLINISYVDDTEVFKTCLDYWNVFVADIYTSSCQASICATAPGTRRERRRLDKPLTISMEAGKRSVHVRT
jgi:hypothetical protein